MSVTITENFLGLDEFKQVETIKTSYLFPWYYQDEIIKSGEHPFEALECGEKYNWQFTHLFYDNDKVNSDYFKILSPIIEKMSIRSLVRIKANCMPGTEKPILHGSHVDFDYEGCITSIFYIDTNNGYTQFKTGEKVGSVANRFVTFPALTYHSGVSCTDEPVRMVINFNYF
jgi:hypothetical protein